MSKARQYFEALRTTIQFQECPARWQRTLYSPTLLLSKEISRRLKSIGNSNNQAGNAFFYQEIAAVHSTLMTP